MIEKAILVSGEASLVGIYCQPDTPQPDAPMLLFWNTGMMHRIGPNRAYVELARAAAACGYASIRFDLSGMGDSPAVRGGGERMERVVTEIQSVMAWAEENGQTGRFVLVGLCSGADDAHHVAVRDARVHGAVCVDGYAFSTSTFWRIRIAQKLRNPVALAVSALRRVGGVLGLTSTGGAPDTIESNFAWSMPPRETVVNEMNVTTERGMHWLCIYTSEVEDLYNYEGQFLDMLPGLKRCEFVTSRFMKEADHTLSSVADRNAFSDMVLTWMSETFS